MNTLEYLIQWTEEVTPYEFYRDVFPSGELETKGIYEHGKYTGIAVSVSDHDRKVKRYSITDDLDVVNQLCDTDDFCVTSPISYAGKSRKSINARYLYALAIDVDGLKQDEYDGEPEGISTLFWQFDGHGKSNYLPLPTYIVYSGSGIHVYYVFEQPIPLFHNVVEQLETYKKRLTWQLWTQGVTDKEHRENIQYESLFQGFRMPGTITKDGKRARAFLIDRGEKVSVEYLNQFVPEQYRVQSIVYKSKLNRAQAKEKYPEWYDKRIVQGKKRGRWYNKRDLYDWWKRQIEAGANDGHRYWCILTLASYAVKCGIPYEELEADAMGFIDLLNERGKRPDNPFTVYDVMKALEAYDNNYVNYPIHAIVDRTGISIQKNKRNGRKRSDHIQLVNATRKLRRDLLSEDEYKNSGRKNKREVVEAWQRTHKGIKADCIRDTGLDRKTVSKYWKE